MILKKGEFSVAGGMWSTIQRIKLQLSRISSSLTCMSLA